MRFHMSHTRALTGSHRNTEGRLPLQTGSPTGLPPTPARPGKLVSSRAGKAPGISKVEYSCKPQGSSPREAGWGGSGSRAARKAGAQERQLTEEPSVLCLPNRGGILLRISSKIPLQGAEGGGRKRLRPAQCRRIFQTIRGGGGSAPSAPQGMAQEEQGGGGDLAGGGGGGRRAAPGDSVSGCCPGTGLVVKNLHQKQSQGSGLAFSGSQTRTFTIPPVEVG